MDIQNEIIEDVTRAVNKTDQTVSRETRNVDRVGRKSSTGMLWIIIVVLLIAIIVVVLPIW